MSILNEIMSRYAMPDNIAILLDSILGKIARKQTETQNSHSLK
jgi:hypothetical protein